MRKQHFTPMQNPILYIYIHLQEEFGKHLTEKLIFFISSEQTMCKKYKHTRLHLLLNYLKQINNAIYS